MKLKEEKRNKNDLYRNAAQAEQSADPAFINTGLKKNATLLSSHLPVTSFVLRRTDLFPRAFAKKKKFFSFSSFQPPRVPRGWGLQETAGQCVGCQEVFIAKRRNFRNVIVGFA